MCVKVKHTKKLIFPMDGHLMNLLYNQQIIFYLMGKTIKVPQQPMGI